MKKIIVGVSLLLLALTQVHAQTVYDGVDFTAKDLNGSARFVGMGGAMGALGGDISTIGTNPAGIGIFRSNDIMVSFGYSALDAEADYSGGLYSASKNRWNFDNVGLVYASKIGNKTALRYVNFGFNYHKAKNFHRNMTMAGNLGGQSQLFQIAGLSDGLTPEYWNNGSIFDNNDIGWLSALAWEGYLVGPSITDVNTGYLHQDANGQQYYIDSNNNLTFDAVGADGKPNNLAYEDYGLYQTEPGVVGISPYLREYSSRESGGIDEYDFNVAFNFNDRVYLGLTVGIYDLDYNKYTLYNEDSQGEGGGGYQIESFNNISGAGVDVKFGAILRPFQYSPLRIGLALHTPIFYKLTHSTSASMISDFATDVIDTYDYLNGGDMKLEYQLKTPWTYNVSLGYTVGNYLALGAEYEYQDYSSMKFDDPDGMNMAFETQQARNYLKGVHTLRVGAEYKVIPQFALRVGYNFQTSPYKDEAIKVLPLNSIRTDTDFMNLKSLNNYTLGIGYRGAMFYADLAYKLSSQKADLYPFAYYELADNVGRVSYSELPPAAKMKFSRSKVLLTIGMRF